MNGSKSPVRVSSIEFDKIYRVMDKRISLGYSAIELSFLLGYRLQYVRDVENPEKTLRYTTKDTNYLMNIFDCKLPELMSGKIDEPFYQITFKVSKYAGGITYRIFRDSLQEQQLLFREFTTGAKDTITANTTEITELTQFLNSLFHNDYFSVPKTALEIFKLCKLEVGNLIKPHSLFTALKTFTFRKMLPKLIQEKNESGRVLYKREG